MYIELFTNGDSLGEELKAGQFWWPGYLSWPEYRCPGPKLDPISFLSPNKLFKNLHCWQKMQNSKIYGRSYHIRIISLDDWISKIRGRALRPLFVGLSKSEWYCLTRLPCGCSSAASKKWSYPVATLHTMKSTVSQFSKLRSRKLISQEKG